MKAVHQAVAHPWLCDIFGHMTTRFYMAIFDDSSYCFVHHLFGWNGARDGDLGWIDVKHTIEYKNEVKAGDLLEVRARLLKVGGKSMTVSYEMIKLASGEIAATLESVMVLFDLNKRRATTIPDDLRNKAQRQL
jgi:acyl-CoA thioester hydrolase